VKSRLAESLGAFRDVYRNENLRRLQLAAAGSILGQYAFTTVLAVYAYLEGGATAVAALAIFRTIPAALLAPFVSVLGDRYRRRNVMLAADLIRATLIVVVAAVALAGWSYWIALALAGLVRVTSMAFRPAESALLPSLARRPEELTAANVSASTIDSIGVFAGPALGGLLLVTTSPGGALLISVCTYLWSALMLARIHPETEPPPREREGVGWLDESTAGFRAIKREPRLRLIVALYSAQTIVAGAEGVLIVVAALDLLELGQSGYGFLSTAGGIGGLIGAFLLLVLATKSRMASSFGIGVALFGLPLIVIGAWPNTVVALLMLGVLGLGNTLTDVAAYTLLQRTAPNDVLARVFGVLHSFLVGTMGIGAIAAPILIDLFGIRAALIGTGLVLPLVSAVLWLKLRQVDRSSDVPERELALLRGVPIFAPLPIATIELLARRLEPLRVEAGRDVFRAGDPGDTFYVVADGEVEILVDGGAKVEGPGGWFGEIALLRDIPRTATVRARKDAELLGLDRDQFLAAVTGYAPSREAADAVVADRLEAPRTGIATA
jgi:MFS family permease